jgi:hypothetical protein
MGNRDDARERDVMGPAAEGRETWDREVDREWRALGDGRYAVWVGMPWGVEVPALVLVTSRRGWARRAEARDPRWTPYGIGPAVVAVRLLGGLRRPEADEADEAAAEVQARPASFDADGGAHDAACHGLEPAALPAA